MRVLLKWIIQGTNTRHEEEVLAPSTSDALIHKVAEIDAEGGGIAYISARRIPVEG